MEPLGLFHSGGRVSYAIASQTHAHKTLRWPRRTMHKHGGLAKSRVDTHVNCKRESGIDLLTRTGSRLKELRQVANVLCLLDVNKLRGVSSPTVLGADESVWTQSRNVFSHVKLLLARLALK